MTSKFTPHNQTSPAQHSGREHLYKLYADSPLSIPDMLINLGLYMRSSALAKILFLDELYRQIIPLPGVIMVFGTWWGQDVVVLHNLRAIHEPYNSLRRVVGFDTFNGYPALSEHDKLSDTIKREAYGTAPGYEAYLHQLLHYHNEENVMGHVPKFEIVAGDVTETLEIFLAKHPETLIALAYLDLALYEPTKRVLELIKPRMLKSAVLAMDELNSNSYPGETQAFREVFGLADRNIKRSQFLPDRSYVIL